MTKLKEFLSKKIEQIERDNWGESRAPVIRLSQDVREDQSGFTNGAIELWVPRRDGQIVLFLTMSLIGIRDIIAIDDCLAELISKALAQHNLWWRK